MDNGQLIASAVVLVIIILIVIFLWDDLDANCCNMSVSSMSVTSLIWLLFAMAFFITDKSGLLSCLFFILFIYNLSLDSNRVKCK